MLDILVRFCVPSLIVTAAAFSQPQQFSGDFALDGQKAQTFHFQPEGRRFGGVFRADLKAGTVNFILRGPDNEVLSNLTARVSNLSLNFEARKAGTYTLEVKPHQAAGHWEARFTNSPASQAEESKFPAGRVDSRLIAGQFVSAGLVILIAVTGVAVWARRSGAGFRWFAAGAAIWATGVALKFAAHSPLNPWYEALAHRQKTVLELLGGSVYAGLMTGVFEIGITLAAVMVWRGLAAGPARAIAIGMGAGCFEALVLGSVGLAFAVGALAGYWRSIASTVGSVPLFWLVTPVERVLTLACHIASRTLVLRAAAGGGWRNFWVGFALLTGADTIGGAVYLSGFLQSRSVWWVELALLPFALLSVVLTRWAVMHWPRGSVEHARAVSAGFGQ